MNLVNYKKKAAMEMSVGTIVTIVLIVAFLIVGIYFLSEIRKGGEEAITGINQQIINQINGLFAEDSSKKIIVYPTTRRISIQKGKDDSGFGFSIRNTKEDEASFSYIISAEETSCDIPLSEADNLISLGKERTGILLPAGTIMDDPIFVRFDIPDSAPPCNIRYSITIQEGGSIYGTPVDIDLEIQSE